MSFSQHIEGFKKDSIKYDNSFNVTSIKRFLIDKNDLLWISTEMGLFKYDGSYLKKVINSKYPSISKSRIVNLAYDYYTGDIIFRTFPELCLYQIHDNKIKRLNYSKYLFSDKETCILPNNKFNKRILNHIYSQHFVGYDRPSIVKRNDSYYVSIVNNHFSGIIIYNKNGEIKEINIPYAKKIILIKLSDKIFIINKGGVYILNENNYKIKKIKVDPFIETCLKEAIVKDKYLDDFFYKIGDDYCLNYDGSVYKITYDNYLKKKLSFKNPNQYPIRLYYIPKLNIFFSHRSIDFKIFKPSYFNIIVFRNSQKNNCYSVVSYNKYWFCASGWLFDKIIKKKQEVSLKRNDRLFIMPYKGELYCNDSCYLYNVKNNKRLYGYSSSRGFSGYSILDSKLWIADVQTLKYQFKNSFKVDFFLRKEMEKIKDIRVNTLFNFNNELVLGTTKGAFFYKPFSKLTPIEGIENHYVRYFKLNDKNSFWVGCYGDGFYLVHRKKAYKVSDLSFDMSSVHAVEEDSAGNIWISTNSGLLTVNKADAIKKILKNKPIGCYKFSVEDGLPSNEFNGGGTNPSLNDRGVLGFTSTKGFVWFDPKKIRKHNFSSTILIEKVSEDGKEIASLYNDSYLIKPKTQLVNIEIGFGYYFDRGKLTVEYSFSDDAVWHKIKDNSIQIMRSLPGKRTLFIRIHTNGLDAKNDVVKTIDLNFEPKFTETSVYWILILGGLIAFICLGFQVGLLVNKKREDLLKIKIDSKTRELQNMVGELTISKVQINKSLKEKEILIKEIHHRVKNNFQLVITLLSYESSKLQNKEVADFLENGTGRIVTIALIHENLYQSENWGYIDFKVYIEKLIRNIIKSLADAKDVIYAIDVDEIFFEKQVAIPLGLITNELIVNTIKHNYKQGNEIKFSLSLHEVDLKHYQLIYKDPQSTMTAKDSKKGSFGIELIQLLTTQLKGRCAFDFSGGLGVTIDFKII
jgi:two-component sensor histidine kinase